MNGEITRDFFRWFFYMQICLGVLRTLGFYINYR